MDSVTGQKTYRAGWHGESWQEEGVIERWPG